MRLTSCCAESQPSVSSRRAPQDYVVSFGERLSSMIATAAFLPRDIPGDAGGSASGDRHRLAARPRRAAGRGDQRSPATHVKPLLEQGQRADHGRLRWCDPGRHYDDDRPWRVRFFRGPGGQLDRAPVVDAEAVVVGSCCCEQIVVEDQRHPPAAVLGGRRHRGLQVGQRQRRHVRGLPVGRVVEGAQGERVLRRDASRRRPDRHPSPATSRPPAARPLV